MRNHGSDHSQQTGEPEPQPPGPQSDPRVRAQVKAHMRELLIAGATAGIGLSATLCSISCDPLPPPVWNCDDSPDSLRLYPDAEWHFVDSLWIIKVAIYLQRAFIDPSLKFTGNPTISGARLDSVMIDSISSEFTCIPDSGVAKIVFEQPMQCESRTFSFKAEIDTTGTQPVEGGGVRVSRIK